ncbi:MAG TPA: hypothetical protein VK680_03320 [Solirubrobacteraceae bacterium]|jgi:hypothetical protein|nr:hypothetical protein [Solirubrobacteraceae bacterium]
MKKLLTGLLPVLLAAGAFAVLPSAALAAGEACHGEKVHVLCSEKNEALRDDLVEPPEGVGGGGYGASLLGVNTLGKIRLCSTITGVKVCNEEPTGYSFFGVKLHSNPLSPVTTAEEENCKEGKFEAKGWITFVDLTDWTTAGVADPVYDNTSPGYNGPWSIGIKSNRCKTNPGVVTIEKVALYFPIEENQKATGTLTGKWSQPSTEKCAGGGIELNTTQSSLKLSIGEKPEIDNGTTGKNAFICFVASNDYLFPKTAPTWAPLTGSIWKD